ncbi:hypothetical protein BDV26DRAFT_266799 [Aspergillus bertholletiae]|uniref:Cytokinesis regulator n=1 Tax=Aspergillus bertholletiae TaxID=1226010 RepID=A0A5N7B186_9EURO|nr:hypothetical protein BDV26DRAFT_266799 [Aspergillus bertholletiae]
MESLTLQVRRGEEETIECWDDDDDLQCYEDIQLRTASSATSVTNSSIRRSGHRDSVSSRRSGRSDLDSNAGGDEDWQVQLLDNEEGVNEEVIASAKNAGIPLPANLPRSALVGGAIKRLGRRKPKQNFVDDWSEDMEFPGPDGVLELKSPQESAFPESLRQISSAATSPVKASPFWSDDISSHLQSALSNLDSYQVNDSVVDADNVPTIRAPVSRPPQKTGFLNDSQPGKQNNDSEDFEQDFELPADDLPLQLSHRQAISSISSPTPDELDVDWSEGSIGVRFGGTTRDHRSNPSSSVSVVSPSASSCLTAESEDEGLDGLIIPEGPLDLESSLRKRQEPKYVTLSHPKLAKPNRESASTDNFFSGLEIEDDDVFNSRRLSINPNVKCKTERPGSPTRRSATTLTFTNTTISPKTRIPRLSNHDRPHSTHLETVSESGAPLSKFRTPPSRGGGHSSHSSLSSLTPSGSTSMSPVNSAPSRRLAGSRVSKGSVGSERIIAGNQLLKKRSMPSMRNTQQPATPSFQRSTSRQDGSNFSTIRPKTPVDRATDVRTLSRKSHAPFIPAGASENQSHHASVKSYRQSRRTNSDSSNDICNTQVPSRLSRSSRHDALNNAMNDSSPEALATSTKRTLTRPTRRRNFGDGTELASFDDLPTSTSAESRFVKLPSGRGAPRSLRSRLNRSHTIPSRTQTPTPQQPGTGTTSKSHDSTPRFARDTNASRNAREQRIASMTFNAKGRENASLTSLNAIWKAQTVSRVPLNSTIRGRKSRPVISAGCKPHLIKPLGAGVQEPKSVNGMQYNPATYRWEGNEGLIQEFEMGSPKSPKSAPALITNVGAMQNVQVVGGMVFDPQRMCWLKLAPLQPGTKGLVAIQDEDDVFAGLCDLEDKASNSRLRNSSTYDEFGFGGSGDDRSCGDSSDEWPMTEEFDVGPEFIRRQRAEEEKWRRKVDKWVSFDRMRFGDGWRWAIRDLVQFKSTWDHNGG